MVVVSEHRCFLDLNGAVSFQIGIGLPVREPAGTHTTANAPPRISTCGRGWERRPLARPGGENGGRDAAMELRGEHPE